MLRSVLIFKPAINQASEMSQNSAARPVEPLPKFRWTDAIREQMLPSDSGPKRIFLLSPANIAGIRAAQVMSAHARSDLAIRLRDGGAPLGEVFSFISGLYFRGKLAYAPSVCRGPARYPWCICYYCRWRASPSRGIGNARAIARNLSGSCGHGKRKLPSSTRPRFADSF
jgi:hypothetical protein